MNDTAQSGPLSKNPSTPAGPGVSTPPEKEKGWGGYKPHAPDIEPDEGGIYSRDRRR